VKLTDCTCACNDLTSFECEAQATGNGSYVKFADTSMEKLVKSSRMNLCFGGFLTFGTTVCRAGLAVGAFVAAAGWLAGRD